MIKAPIPTIKAPIPAIIAANAAIPANATGPIRPTTPNRINDADILVSKIDNANAVLIDG